MSVEVVTDINIYGRAFDYIAPRAHLLRDLEHEDRIIAFVENDEILGALLFSDYDGNNIMIHLALDHPKVCSRKHIKLMYDYCFNQCGCSRISAICKNGYERNEKLLRGIGFKKEGVIRHILHVDNEWIDGALYGILKGECKWV
jgi:RimJ/RimL family protein N-acetyltransferase